MTFQINVKRGNNTYWRPAEGAPVLAEGELGYNTDTNEFKIGDGVSNFSTLPPAGLTKAPADGTIRTLHLKKSDGTIFWDKAGEIYNNQIILNAEYTGDAPATSLISWIRSAPDVPIQIGWDETLDNWFCGKQGNYIHILTEKSHTGKELVVNSNFTDGWTGWEHAVNWTDDVMEGYYFSCDRSGLITQMNLISDNLGGKIVQYRLHGYIPGASWFTGMQGGTIGCAQIGGSYTATLYRVVDLTAVDRIGIEYERNTFSESYTGGGTMELLLGPDINHMAVVKTIDLFSEPVGVWKRQYISTGANAGLYTFMIRVTRSGVGTCAGNLCMNIYLNQVFFIRGNPHPQYLPDPGNPDKVSLLGYDAEQDMWVAIDTADGGDISNS